MRCDDDDPLECDAPNITKSKVFDADKYWHLSKDSKGTAFQYRERDDDGEFGGSDRVRLLAESLRYTMCIHAATLMIILAGGTVLLQHIRSLRSSTVDMEPFLAS
eukprot:gnl/TRDRNA2_/TRDRNA2_173370_c1_seq4.p1 gnl/TRDRNA2_/TRDRNA2_173370_c1~~gnl/TRDRNA2_/TRDRNA2_173370_c1_seq4.p1  ORF type:complete len:105 (+),score=13.63 gnl/TRDRNA2_/TRDRNA2_173370_c1_seq4:173-487(+)